ncbi:carboxymuconolactone decarboxylase family protein [Bacteroidales bacterium OttesenSCG-928-K22]|nr:carboxymuconolactone decarboxylase family protein [Bacteroidales bacterium OttesenSCG-928-L14]MDL2240684.1 carboxymuconolactone decarboxylase family protein [Bacteroidales bacterium OttesenSCG-928-K22]
MKKFNITSQEKLPANNVKTLESLNKALGFTPNIYSFMANSATALNGFMSFNKMETLFNAKEHEVINLTASQIRKCEYCLSAHVGIAKNAGFSDEEIVNIRKGEINFNEKFAALAEMTAQLVKSDGHIPEATIEKFYNVGYTDAHLVDFMMIVAAISITNWLNNTTKLPVDFPLAPEI